MLNPLRHSINPSHILDKVSKFELNQFSAILQSWIFRKFSTTKKKNKKQDKTKPIVCTIDDSMVDPCKTEPSVIIIGAGIAGLSAAQRLVSAGIRNLTILEATERPGGRIHSCWLGDVIAEMGCDHIAGGCATNPIYNLAAQEGLLKKPLSREDHFKGLYCTSDGRAVESSIVLNAYHAFQKIRYEAYSLFSLKSGTAHGSLQNFLSLKIQQELQNFPEDQRYDASRILFGLTSKVRDYQGDDLSKVGANNFGSRVFIPGGNIRVPKGFISILAPLMRELPDCSLKFNKPVGLIKWGAVQEKSKGPRAVVQCCDGEEFCGDYVLVTVSLGVLKEHGDRLFCPALPCGKMDAIKNLGYGTKDRIFLDYERPFWVNTDGCINMAWSADEINSCTDWTRGISSIREIDDSNHVLTVNISGPEAAVMEQASDEEVAQKCTNILRQFTGDSTIPYPNSILRSKWHSDPYFCGSFSYMKIESTVGHQCDLGCPVPGGAAPPVLLFAGEATCVGHHSTVQGGRLSGIREAERIIKLTKKFGGPPPKCHK